MENRRLRKTGVTLVVVLVALGLMLVTATAWAGGKKEEGPGSLTVYTMVAPEEAEPFFNAFQEETGIQVEYIYSGGSGRTVTRIRSESENPQGSLVFGGSADNYVALHDDGLLEPYQSANIDQIPEHLRDPEGVWNPMYIGVLGVAGNTDLLNDLDLEMPSDWSDLTEPQYASELGMGHPASSGTAYTVLATLVQLFGEDEAFEFLSRARDNGLTVTQSTGASIQAMTIGERAFAIAFSHDLLEPRVEEGRPIEVMFPESGSGYEIGASGVLANGPNKENAKRFVDWVTTADAQDNWVVGGLKLPTNPDAEIPEGAVQIDQISLIDYSFEFAGANRDRLVERFQEEIATIE